MEMSNCKNDSDSLNQIFNQSDLPNRKSNIMNKIIILLLSLIIIILVVSLIVVNVKLRNKKNGDNNENNKDHYIQLSFDAFSALQTLIKTTNITNENIVRAHYKNVKEKIKTSTNLTDGTYNLITKEPISFKEGYQVSFETDDRNYQNGYYTDDEYDEIVYKLASILNVNASLGVYETIPEISYHIKDKNLSLGMASLFNQISIWDWSNDIEILNELRQNKKN